MARWNAAETGSDRVALAQDAGMGRISLFGVLAGALVAYGAFVVLSAIASAIGTAISDDIDLPNLNWEQLGIVSALIVAAVLLVSYFFGGYVAGRMARRSGAINGLLVFVLSVLVVLALTLLVNALVDNEDAIAQNLRNAGIPTSSNEWGDTATVAGLASLAAMVVGAVLGGIVGERWHGKLTRRAMDPSMGAQARHRQMAAERQAAEEESWRQRSSPPPPPARPEREEGPVTTGPRTAQQPRTAQEPQTTAQEPQTEEPRTAWGASRPWASEPPPESPPAAGPGSEPDREVGSGPRVTRRPRTGPPRTPRPR